MNKKKDLILSLESEIQLEKDCLNMAETLNYTVKNYLLLIASFNFDFKKIYTHLIFLIKQQEEN